MTATANLASAEADAGHAAPAPEAEAFVLNLCSSTTPMALAQTDLPELKRFTFFVSRRFEEGRERFRLHMGFFTNQAEAEEWLSVVRDIYPGAWAGEAPGKKLRARAAEAAAAQARHAVGPQKTALPSAAAPPTLTPSAARPQSAPPAAPSSIPTLVPTIHPPQAAPAGSRASVSPAAATRAVARSAKAAQQPPPKRPAAASPAARTAPAAAARAPAASQAASRPVLSARPVAPPAPQARTNTAAPAVRRAAAKSMPQSAARPVPQPAKKPLFSDSNVKEVLAALDEHASATGETRLMPSLAAQADDTEDSTLTDTQVLRFLETRRQEDGSGGDARPQSGLQPDADVAAESGISLLKPDDTGTRRALKEAVSHNEPVSFAVQLQWSVQPVELDKVPPLAIFSAYTLYSVEGSREGRKWYGLRLGFFNDAISAKQVAYYVRSEFTSVAVVPVSPQERGRATEDDRRFAGGAARARSAPGALRRAGEDNEFKLIDAEEAQGSAAAAAPPPAPMQPAAAAAKPAAAAPSVRAGGGKVAARERRTPQTLEETLEILGANELAIDNGSGTLSDTGVRHLRVEVQKNTPFSRLLERLSERVRKT